MNKRFDPETTCRYLRCKEMFAQGDNEAYRKETLFDPYDATAYWCSKTQNGRGPDGQPARLEDCSRGCGRVCYLGWEALV